MKIQIVEYLQKKYRNVYIVQNRSFWDDLSKDYSKNEDLVLSFDFGLVNYINNIGGNAAFFDHIVSAEIMQFYNFKTYKFFDNWYIDQQGNDIFEYNGITTGNASRIEIWNEITYYPRVFVSMLAVKRLQYGNLFIGVNDNNIFKIADILSVNYTICFCTDKNKYPEYYFPIFRWMNEQICHSDNSIKQKLRSLVSGLLSAINSIDDLIFFRKSKYVYLMKYYPTASILKKLCIDKKVKVVLSNYSWDCQFMNQRRLLIHPICNEYLNVAEQKLKLFSQRKTAQFDIEGYDISSLLYEIIIRKISNSLPYYFSAVDSILAFCNKRMISLAVTVTEIGVLNQLILNFCKKNNVPVCFVINGFLTSEFVCDVREASVINSYGVSIKNHYFRNIENVVSLGDPRMDLYSEIKRNKPINYVCPVVVIGAGGFNNSDLNSYVAVEFDFLYDILNVLKRHLENGKKMEIILKVRANGYLEQYREFVKDFFPELSLEIFDSIPIRKLLVKADLYISIYSQTLFEASCLGASVIYYKKDTEINFPPFDGQSELQTAFNKDDLYNKIKLFYENDSCFNLFKKRSVMEKYVGPLDGSCLTKNMEMIYSELRKEEEK